MELESKAKHTTTLLNLHRDPQKHQLCEERYSRQKKPEAAETGLGTSELFRP